ncbi:MAG: twitching motility protein PilT [Bacteroidetes bacterium RIFOXYA12_FULL_35_11]|nr:MAG: twitching motility protein PilT [Bacteroidetes bacterium GWF2_35_48]OFY72520.1 MAG: twitching motility protein PilT [Bacteroidetes bacterium RIFOXYA12_FULL_35_11]OFY96892.1 MAG: twitching motility protein PilT [Bacteroidetes bacterium RIFOXYB2_FULL_35_7]OFZ03141.1 MAG: twitching motility protein PilT [Bacteroidetes bacterium RIFOXYC12_FULL_35_7]HBX50225.1 PIN domain nuclease [Bacteroidales bacterium]
MILLDSSILIDLFRKQNKEKTMFHKLIEIESEFCISSVTHYEIGLGNKKSYNQFWNELYNNITVIPFDKSCSATAIEIYIDLKGKNKLIDIADIWIAATAKTYNLRLATLNKKHFIRISGLELIL